ncbi:acyltransferase [uncultured Gelidibacter sp.]|uniref:acyltransferase n=1 Tax=uncultured Gelidibacter sp. TaxID=259318 RepID=UPI00262ACF43|nr:acyltransferase [uncultured Gelidibacter sp.]
MSWRNLNKIRRISRISIIKTLFLNFTKLPWHQAIKLPIILSNNTYFYDLSGRIKIEGIVSTGMIRLGFLGEDTKVWHDNKILLKIMGTLIFKGKVNLGVGVSIQIQPEAELIFGSNILMNYNSKIICYEYIEIGANSRFAWDCQLIDTDLHFIKNKKTGELSKRNSPIKIGENNWIGNRVSIMKGTVTPNYCIIASLSLCNKNYDIPNYSLIAGTPAKLIKTDVYRVLEEEEAQIITLNSNKN